MTRIGKEITLLSSALIVVKSLSSAHKSIMEKGTVQNAANPLGIVVCLARKAGARPV
jgi:hypothetical protein